MSERRACRLVNQPRGTQRYQPTQREDEDALTRAIVALASQYGRYGYRRITALLQAGRLASGQGPGGAHLASRGAEGSAEAEAARAAVAQRRFVRAAAAGAGQPRLVLRLRQRVDPRWKDGADAEPDR